MAGFSADWLAWREPADHRSRSGALAARLYARLARREALRVVDLGAGSGSNLRWLLPHGPARQHWRVVDHDPALLEALHVRTRAWAVEHRGEASLATDGQLHVRLRDRSCHVEAVHRDLVPWDGAVLAGEDLVTGAALLDLASASWIRELVAAIASAGAAALFTLTYDGRMACTPEEPDDAWVRALVNCHQRTDKGFGPAAGPGAVDEAVRAFEAAGYVAERDRSDWVIDAEPELQRALVRGWGEAALEMAPSEASRIAAWTSARLLHVDRQRSVLTVGHEDLAAWPAVPDSGQAGPNTGDR